MPREKELRLKKDDILALTGEKDARKGDSFSRRSFFRLSAMSVAGLAVAQGLGAQEKPSQEKPKPAPVPEIKTNIGEVRSIPRVATSMPGRYPGEVVKIDTETAS